MDWEIVVVVVLAMLLAVMFVAAQMQKGRKAVFWEKQKLMDEEAQLRIPEFERTLDEEWPVRHHSVGKRRRDYIMMSGDQRRLRFSGASFHPEFQLQRDATIAVETIVTVELQQSSETITRYVTSSPTKQGSPLMRAAVGGLAFGGAGAVVGAVSAKKTSTGTATGKSETRNGPIHLIVGTTDIHTPMVKHEMPNMATAEDWLHRIRGAIALIDRTS